MRKKPREPTKKVETTAYVKNLCVLIVCTSCIY